MAIGTNDPASGRPDTLWLLAAAAFLVRAAFILLEPETRLVGDERTWTNWAIENLLTEKVGLNPLRTHMIFYPPLYPYFIAVLYAPFVTLEAVKWGQAVVGALLVPAVGLVGRRVFGPRTGLLAAAITALYPELVWFTAHFWSETLFVALLWWSWERLFAADEPGRRTAAAIAAGLLWGLAVLVRETALYFTPFAALFLAWPREDDGRRWRREGGVFAVAVLLTVAPWTWRNHRVFDAFVPVSTAGGQNLFQGNCLIPRDETYVMVDAVRGRIEQYRYARSMGLSCIAERQPTWALEKLRDEMPNFWEADSLALIHVKRGAYGAFEPSTARIAAAVVLLPYLLLLPGLVVGLARVAGGGSRRAWLLAGFLVYYNAIHVATHGFARYRLPVMPIVFLLAAWALAGRSAAPERPRAFRAALGVLALAALLVIVPSLARNWRDPAYALSRTPAAATSGDEP